MTSHLSWGEGGLWLRDFPSSFVLASDYGDGSGASHGKGSSSKGCEMGKTRKGSNCPRQEKGFLMYKLFLLSQTICNLQKWHHIYLGVRVGSGSGISLQVLSLQVTMALMLVLLMAKVLPPKVVRWARLGREEITPDKKKALLCIICFCFPKAYVIHRSDITFMLGWGWALAQGFPFQSCPCKWSSFNWCWCFSWQRLSLHRFWNGQGKKLSQTRKRFHIYICRYI